jgi:hypothetical protein
VGPTGNPVKCGGRLERSNAGGPAIRVTGRRSSAEIRRPSGVVRRRDLRIVAFVPEMTLRIVPPQPRSKRTGANLPILPEPPEIRAAAG